MKLRLTASAAGARPVDLAAVGCYEGEKDFLARIPALDAHSREKIQKTLAAKKFSGRAGDAFFLPAPTRAAGALFFVGLGKRDKHTLEGVRRAASKLLAQAKAFRYETARMELGSFDGAFDPAETVAAAVEGLRLSDYRFTKYKSKPEAPASVREVELAVPAARVKSLARALAEAEIVSDSVRLTRDLANEPANVMTPVQLGESARKAAREAGLSCKVLGLAEIKALKMGGILGVSQGSSHPPRLVILEHKPRSAKSGRPVVLVGKGVTFDTGGISIKPSGDMDKMKFDMSGAAAVIGALVAASRLELPLHVVGLAPIVENMPGSKAQRPGDIIRAMNGKTIEVLNTDAEGRLILADALSYAERWKPRALVDIATLTGACASTFADKASGVMGTDADLVKRVIAAGEKAGERCWELPLWDEYAELIRATYADIQNISKKNAGTITAGMFLKNFSAHAPWAHLDVAGTAWADSPKPLSAVGSTGVGVRLFVNLLRGFSR